MSKIIIGIHGLGNKPPKQILVKWWKQAITDGLKKIGCPGVKFNFKLVYWADTLHTTPLDLEETDKNSELYCDERYLPPTDKFFNEPKNFKNKALNYLRKQLDNILFNEKMHINFPSFTDYIIKHFFNDLNIYFTQNCVEENMKNCPAKDVIRNKLKMVLKKHNGKGILLIAHSMGSIISYDVLMENEKRNEIDTFVTQGSPLAVPFIYDKIKYDLGINDSKTILRTPDNIKNEWLNLVDPGDKLAQYHELQNLFTANTNNVKPYSKVVANDYEYDGIENPHKVYGYLRTPELAQTIDEFLSRGRNKVVVWITKKFRRLFAK